MQWLAVPVTTKVGRKPEDVAKLAESLRARWEPADGIEPWLKRNRARFERMVRRDRWTWQNIADALTKAGITYNSGRPWEGKVLATKVSEIRVRQRIVADRKEQEKRRALDGQRPPPGPQATAAIVPAPLTEHPSQASADAIDVERERLRAKFGTGSTLRTSVAPQESADAIDAEPESLRAKFGTGSTLRTSVVPHAARPTPPSTPLPQRTEQEVEDMIARAMGRPSTRKSP